MKSSLARIFFGAALLFAVVPAAAFAAPPSSPYAPGETLSPNCVPGNLNCTVASAASAGSNADITSLNALQAATTSMLAVTGIASTSALVVSNSFTFGTLTGFLKAVGGVVSNALVNLATDVTGVLPMGNGGTGTSTVPSYGQLLAGNSAGGYGFIATSSLGLTTSNVAEGSNLYFTSARVGNALSTILQSGSGVNIAYNSGANTITISGTGSGGGGTDVNWTYFNNLIHPATSTNQVVIGGAATSSSAKLTVIGGAMIDNATTTNAFVAALVAQSATTSNLAAANLSLGSLNGFLKAAGGVVGTSLVNLAADVTGIVPIANGGTGIASAPGYGQIAMGNGAGGYAYTATSSLGLTTSAITEGSNLYFTNARVQSYLDSLAKGYFFATSSAAYWQSQNNFFSTTSASYFLAQNTNAAFSTTSSSYWFSSQTTDNLPQGSVNKYYSTNLLAADLAGTTTDALREGLVNLYWTPARFDARLTATTSLPGITSLANLASVGTIASGIWHGSAIAPAYGGTGISAPQAAGVLIGNYAGTGYQQIATSSLGLTTSNVAEGSNLYFTAARAQAAISVAGSPLTYSSGVLGIAQANASQSGYLSSSDWNVFNGKMSSTSLSAGAGISYNASTGAIANTGIVSNTGDWAGTLAGQNGSYYLNNSFSTTSAAYFLAQNQSGAFATTSSNYWLTTQSTSNLAEGSNLYWTSARFDARLAATTSLPNITSLANLATVGTITSGVWNGSAVPIASGGTGASSFAAGKLIAYNGTSFVSTSTVTAASSTLLADNSNFSGSDSFLSLLGLGNGANVSGQSGNGYQIGGNTVLYASTTNSDLAIGASSTALWMSKLPFPNYNIAIGQGALATTPVISYDQNNTAVGYSTLTQNNSGWQNTAIGSNALYSDTGGTNNTAIGFQSGYDVTGSNNLILGNELTQGTGITSGGNNILLGTDLQLKNISGLSQTASNQLDIGNLIFGSGLSSGSILSNGTVGIGTTTPSATLAVNGGLFVTASSTYMNGINLASGCFSVGGTCLSLSSLGGTLSVASGGTGANSFASGKLIAYNGTSFVATSTIGNGQLQSSTISGIALGGTLGNLSAANGSLTLSGAYNGSVAQTLAINPANPNAWTGLQSFSAGASTTALSVAGPAYFGTGSTSTFDAAGNLTIAPGKMLTVAYASTTALTISGNAYLGTITSGTWNAGLIPLAYGGTGAASALAARANLGAAASGANSDITSLTGLTAALTASQGGTGLASITANQLLVGNPSGTGWAQVSTSSLGLTLSSLGGTLAVSQGGTGASSLSQGWVYSAGGTGALAASTSPTVNYVVATSTSVASTFAASVVVGGKVTAGSGFNGACVLNGNVPVSILGSLIINLTGSLSNLTCNQDLAEAYPSYEPTAPGEIVAIPPQASQALDSDSVVEVGAAHGVAGEQVLGVVSTDPGVVFANGATYFGGDNTGIVSATTTIVALAGKVPVDVSLANGAIEPGDELVVSTTTPGVAVRAIGPGTVIGVALQAYAAADPSATTTPQILMFVHTGFSLGTDDAPSSPLDQFTRAIQSALQFLGVSIADGVATLQELDAHKVQTQELCVGDTCVDSAQLQALLQIASAQSQEQTSVQASVQPQTQTQQASATVSSMPPVSVDASTTTDAASSTPEVPDAGSAASSTPRSTPSGD